ncbi:MAG: 3-phosphoshikimate 1-carboxyvinyltransferase [Termitinemataceae bacterium]|nr:MAG: 3-phosphoshikimate 1-carboxyvinyltransferase [Termitinemataceae bacterium]
MDCIIHPHVFNCAQASATKIPASKSHTIRRLLIASLATGTSRIDFPLDSLDARSCLAICRSLGAQINEHKHNDVIEYWDVKGIGGAKNISAPLAALDVGNSGTTLFLALCAASLCEKKITFTGDSQIARRSAAPLLDALKGLGVSVTSGGNGCIPITVQGPWHGGKVSVECPTSQYLSALLLASPLAPLNCTTEIDVPLLNERPYIEMTLSYLEQQKIAFKKNSALTHFVIQGGQKYVQQNGAVPADFSSAAFPACAAVISGGSAELLGLDKNDHQGDKYFFDILEKMGASVVYKNDRIIVGGSGQLKGGTFDLNDTPDLLPVCAVLAAYSKEETRLINVAHARIKETDRITVMYSELTKLGITCSELPDGLVIKGGQQPLGEIVADGHGDHRVVMALAVCALGAAGKITIKGAEAADVTYPGFLELCM